MFALIRLNREYRTEARVLETIGERRASSGGVQRQPNYSRRVVIVFVDDFDLSTVAALRYAKSLRPTVVRAVHFVIDTAKAEQLRIAWLPDRRSGSVILMIVVGIVREALGNLPQQNIYALHGLRTASTGSAGSSCRTGANGSSTR